jgi:hypothetical protein
LRFGGVLVAMFLVIPFILWGLIAVC